MDIKLLINTAIKARENAYTPYSHFKVGAALLSQTNKIFSGCNIESATFTPTICAERTAFSKAVSDGVLEFEAIAIVGAMDKSQLEICPPCGVCRQVMQEFCKKDFKIILAKSETEYVIKTLEELLPLGFGMDNLI